jgi:hypothetical protein
MGTPTDEIFVADLLAIIDDGQFPWRTKTLAWIALLRINPEKPREAILARAWRDIANHAAAARFIVLDDEQGARSALEKGEPELDRHQRARLQETLAETARQRRRWRERHGYAL